jgi:hypothetical protein
MPWTLIATVAVTPSFDTVALRSPPPPAFLNEYDYLPGVKKKRYPVVLHSDPVKMYLYTFCIAVLSLHFLIRKL